MSFATLHKLVCYLVAGLGFVALAIGPELEPASEVPMFVGLALSWFAEGARVRDPRWARGWTIALVAFLALQVLRGVLGGGPLALALEFTAALQVSRLFNRRSAREHQQIGALALLHLIAATVLSAELSYGLVFIGFVVVLPWTFALGHLRAEIEAQRTAAGESAETADAVERVLASKSLVGARFLAGTAALSLPLFFGTALLFLLFPRVGLGFLSFGRDMGQRVSGFGADVELGDFGTIRTDPTVVLRVEPPDLPPEPPPFRMIRMRGTSFDHYDGRRWTRSRDLGSQTVTRYEDSYALPHRLPIPTRDQRWEIVLDPLDEPVIFFPPRAVGLQIPTRVESGIEVGRDLHAAPGLDVRYADADGLGLRYTVWTSERPRRPEEANAALLRYYLQVPDGHERVAALARTWTEGVEGDAARAERLVARLRDAGEFEYSLEMPRLRGRLPLDVFLFEARRGHCEYYATALAIQLRTLGIPARNVTGFLGGRFNAFGRYYALSQGDAHSWVEAWVDGRWVTFDPTPPARDELSPELGWAGSLGELLDAVETRWTDQIVSFDLRSQVDLLRGARRFLWSRPRGPRDPSGAGDPAAAAPAARWPWVAAGALALAAVLWLAWRRRRRRREGDPEAAEARAAVALLRALDEALARAGHARPAARTPTEHAGYVSAAGYPGSASVREVTERYEETRFGGAPLDRGEHARLEALVRALPRATT